MEIDEVVGRVNGRENKTGNNSDEIVCLILKFKSKGYVVGWVDVSRYGLYVCY